MEDWKSGHKTVCKAPGSTSKVPQGPLPKIDKPFTRIERNIFLHNLPENDVHAMLIDAFRMRQEDEYQYGKIDMDSIYSGKATSLAPFGRFLQNAEKERGILPAWWNETKRNECINLGMGGHEWADLSRRVEKHDIQEHYADDLMPMKLRMLAEAFCSVGPWGVDGKEMRQQMMKLEGTVESSTDMNVCSRIDLAGR